MSVFPLGLVGLSVVFVASSMAGGSSWSFLGLTIDRLSVVFLFLGSTVGAVVFRFSRVYLEGDPGRSRFLRWLLVTVSAACVMMLSTHLVLLFVGWLVTSVGLHQLLTFYGDRNESKAPARKKFLISRLGDLFLASAIVLIGLTWSTLDLNELRSRWAEPMVGPWPTVIGLLIVVAALTKSAQFPFHSWLPETMESPTPVSALMHAGIINAGGVVLIRFAPLISRVPESLFLLSLVGSVTMAVGLLAMWSQVSVKRALAWSTVAQMGFMMVQCGLAVYPAAVLHIVGHGFYKAWGFLRSSELPRGGMIWPAFPIGNRLATIAAGVVVAIPALVAASWVFGVSPLESSGEAALGTILALSMGVVWSIVLESSDLAIHSASRPTRLALLVFLDLVTAFCGMALYRGAGLFLAPVLGDLPIPTGPTAWATAWLPVLVLTVLIVVRAGLPGLVGTRRGRSWFVQAQHGFYLGAVADRIVGLIWTRWIGEGRGHA